MEWLTFSGFGQSGALETDDGWTRYTLAPGPYAHNLFMEGEAPEGDAAFQKLVLEASDEHRTVSLGTKETEVCFHVTIEGCRFSTLLDALALRLHQVMVVRTEVFSTAVQEAQP